MAYKEIDQYIKEFDSLQDLLDMYEGSINCISVDDDKAKLLYTKQNGYRIISITVHRDYPTFNPDAEGIYLPIATFASTRFRDTKSISTPIFDMDKFLSEYERDWIINDVISFNQFQVYIGNGYVNIIVENRLLVFDVFESITIAIVMDMMYDTRKNGLEYLLSIIDNE